jgi:hypothetical protein
VKDFTARPAIAAKLGRSQTMKASLQILDEIVQFFGDVAADYFVNYRQIMAITALARIGPKSGRDWSNSLIIKTTGSDSRAQLAMRFRRRCREFAENSGQIAAKAGAV